MSFVCNKICFSQCRLVFVLQKYFIYLKNTEIAFTHKFHTKSIVKLGSSEIVIDDS